MRGRVEQIGLVALELVRAAPAPARPAAGAPDVCHARSSEHAQHAGALDVAQELVAESPSLARTFDEAGHVGDDVLHRRPIRTTPRFGSSVVNG